MSSTTNHLADTGGTESPSSGAVDSPAASDTTIGGRAVPFERMSGHWVLARLGKRVLRPGGRELTDHLLAGLDIGSDDDVVEIAPGLGSTTELVLARNPRSYRGIDRDPAAVSQVARAIAGPNRSVSEASAADTGLESASADVAFGEAYLTMQPDSQKRRIVDELARVVRPGGRIGLHEVSLEGGPVECEAARADLKATIKVNVSPLSADGWSELVEEAGFRVLDTWTLPLHLLEPRRLVSDEGFVGAGRFALNLARNSGARRRVLAMRSAMRRHARSLHGFGLIAERL